MQPLEYGYFPREVWLIIISSLEEKLPAFLLVSKYTNALFYESILKLDVVGESDRKLLLDRSLVEKCPNLEFLHIEDDMEIGGDQLKDLKHLHTLLINKGVDHYKYLDFFIGDPDITRLTNLTNLRICDMPITNHGISVLTNLTELSIYGSHDITDDGIRGLINLRSLECGLCITDAGISHMTNLRVLKPPSRNYITNCSISKLTGLTSLDIPYTSRITDEGIWFLTDLTTLNIRNGQVTGECIERFTNLRKLSCYFGPVEYQHFSGLTNLTELYYYGETENGLLDTSLSNLKHMRVLHLGGKSILTGEMIRNMTNLSSLMIGRGSDKNLIHNKNRVEPWPISFVIINEKTIDKFYK